MLLFDHQAAGKKKKKPTQESKYGMSAMRKQYNTDMNQAEMQQPILSRH